MIHPYFTLRLAGLPAAAARIGDGSALSLIEALDTARQTAKRQAVALGPALEASYPDIEEISARRALLEVKRALFNLRLPKARALAALDPAIAPRLRAQLAETVGAVEALQEGEARLTAIYAGEIAAGRAALAKLYEDEGFRAAIQLSNPLVRSRLDKLFGPDAAALSAKSVASLWLALAAYALRASRKTSPQSSFGTVAVGEWAPSGSSNLAALPPGFRTIVALRRAPVEHLIGPLLRTLDALAEEAPLRLNPSLRGGVESMIWTRITNDEAVNDRTRGAVTASSKAAANKALFALVDILRGLPEETAPLGMLRQALAGRLPEPLHSGIGTLLQRALDHHILETLPHPEQEGAVASGRLAAANLVMAVRAPVEQALTDLDEAARDLAAAPRSEAAPRLAAVEAAFERLGDAVGRPVKAADYRPIIHDDCAAEELALSPADLGDVIPDLERLLDLTCLFGGTMGYATARFAAADRFVELYGRDGCCEDVEAFLSDVADRVSAGMARRMALGESGSPVPLEHDAGAGADAQVQALAHEFAGKLAAVAAAGEDRALDWGFVESVRARIPEAVRTRTVSHCINGQLLEEPGGALRFAVNQIYPGNSRMLSRFLGNDGTVRQKVSAYLTEVAGGARHAAIPGVFGFNANLHPRFSDLEMEIAPFAPDRADTHKLPLTSIRLRFDSRTEQVYAVDSTGAIVRPFYVGILMSQRLPPLHRMLDQLGGTGDGVVPIWLAVARRMPGYGSETITLPRLTLGSLVIVRRTCCVPKGCFPDSRADDLGFFRSVQEWRTANRVPRHVFFHRRSDGPALFRALQEGKLDERQRQMTRKMNKPAYADLASPICVQLLKRNIAAQDEDIVFAEALPDGEQAMARVGGAATLSELSIEVTRRGR